MSTIEFERGELTASGDVVLALAKDGKSVLIKVNDWMMELESEEFRDFVAVACSTLRKLDGLK